MKIEKKAQSGLEFLILIGAIFFIFLIFLYSIQGSISGKAVENRNSFLEEIALTLQNEINLAKKTKDGYYREFELPLKLVDLDYTISIEGGPEEYSVYIRTEDGSYAASYPIDDVKGYVQPGLNILRKENGVICINDFTEC